MNTLLLITALFFRQPQDSVRKAIPREPMPQHITRVPMGPERQKPSPRSQAYLQIEMEYRRELQRAQADYRQEVRRIEMDRRLRLSMLQDISGTRP